MVSGADVRMALEAGLWKALLGSGDRAAMRSSCRDAMAMGDMLHDTAVLPLRRETEPDMLGSAASIAAYHHRLGTVRALHVRYSAEDDASHCMEFLEAYSAALGTALPATHCIIEVATGRQLPPPFVAVLLQRVVPGVERVDMALGSYRSLGPLLQALEPCTRLHGLRILLMPSLLGLSVYQRLVYETDPGELFIRLYQQPGVLDALCKLSHLRTLSGPWLLGADQLKRLCDALPSLTTLGFHELALRDPPGACISRQLHTLAACDDAAGAGAARIGGLSAIATTLPAVQRLKGVSLCSLRNTQADMLAVRNAVQRFAACAHEWRLEMCERRSTPLVAQGLPAGCLAPLQHLELNAAWRMPSAAGVAAMMGCLVPAAPNLATVQLVVRNTRGSGWEEFVAVVAPLRQAAHLHTLRLEAFYVWGCEQQAALLEAVVRCLALPGAAGEVAPCRALQRVLLRGATPDALGACRRALERHGITMRVDTWY